MKPNTHTKLKGGIVPAPLQSRDQWVLWKEETPEGRDEVTKVPYQTTDRKASSTDPETWTDFDSALEAAYMNPTVNGIGFVFSKQDMFVGVDLDDCVDPETGEIDNWAQWVIAALDSYTHISTSGTGLHTIVLGTLPEGGNRRGEVEIYSHARFFAFTGDRLDAVSPTVEQRTDELAAVWEAYIGDDEDEEREVTAETVPTTMTDQDVINKAREADYKDDTFERLFDRGDTSKYATANNDGHSEADSALCSLLAWWTGYDHQQIDRIFRKSALMRPKWDESRGGESYGELTIRKACAIPSGQYTPPKNTPEEKYADIDDEQLDKPVTRSGRVFTAAQELATTAEVTVPDGFTAVDDRLVRHDESGQTVELRQAVAYDEKLTDEVDEYPPGRDNWIKLGKALRYRGGRVPEYRE